MIILVTGGSGGLGQSICLRLARAGHAVYVGCFRNPAVADRLCDALRAAGGRATPAPFDVADPEQVEAAVERVAREAGGLDGLVNAAAHNVDGLLWHLAAADAERILAVNVLGAMNCVRAAIPHLMRSSCARVVQFSSVLAQRPIPGVSGYAASKGAIEALTRALATELGPKRIVVNAVAPGFIDAGLGRPAVAAAGNALESLLPLCRAGTADDVAKVVEFLLSESAAYLTGVVLPVDGGLLAGTRMFAAAAGAAPAPPADRSPRDTAAPAGGPSIEEVTSP